MLCAQTALQVKKNEYVSSYHRILLDHGASTTLPDSNGRLINIPAFAGTQFLIETSRKDRRKRIISALQNRLPLKEFMKMWQVRIKEGGGGREREISTISASTSLIKIFHKPLNILASKFFNNLNNVPDHYK